MLKGSRWLRAIFVSLLFLLALFPAHSAIGGAGLSAAEPNGEYREFEQTRQSNPYIAPRKLRSPLAMAEYVVLLLVALGAIVLFVGRNVKQPARISIVPLVDSSHSFGEAEDYTDRTSAKLMSSGFYTRLDFTIPELPHEGRYRLMSTRDGDHTVLIAQIQAAFSQSVDYLEYQTTLDNGIKINTNNSPMKPPLDMPYNLISTNHPSAGEPDELFRLHRASVDSVRMERGGNIRPQRMEDFERDFQEEWTDTLEHQVSVGLMKRNASGDAYHGTWMVVLRALSPAVTSAQGSSWTTMLPAIGAALMAFSVWNMPNLVSALGLENSPVLAQELEAGMILFLAMFMGYEVATGGYLLGLACYVPTMILFVGGPISHIILAFLAATSGLMGEKIKIRPAQGGMPWLQQLSPELYITIALLLVAGI